MEKVRKRKGGLLGERRGGKTPPPSDLKVAGETGVSELFEADIFSMTWPDSERTRDDYGDDVLTAFSEILSLSFNETYRSNVRWHDVC